VIIDEKTHSDVKNTEKTNSNSSKKLVDKVLKDNSF
jgi:hypothetical protein